MTGQRVRTVALTAIAVASSLAVAGRDLAAPDPPDTRLPQLLRDRVTVRKQLIDRFEKLKLRGGASAVEVLLSTRDLLWAELDTLSDKAGRVKKLEQIVDHEKKITAFYERTPDLSEVERLLLKVRLLDAEITLERERGV
jgi:hypothetical protein